MRTQRSRRRKRRFEGNDVAVAACGWSQNGFHCVIPLLPRNLSVSCLRAGHASQRTARTPSQVSAETHDPMSHFPHLNDVTERTCWSRFAAIRCADSSSAPERKLSERMCPSQPSHNSDNAPTPERPQIRMLASSYQPRLSEPGQACHHSLGREIRKITYAVVNASAAGRDCQVDTAQPTGLMIEHPSTIIRLRFLANADLSAE
jgi:hypothetical protein